MAEVIRRGSIVPSRLSRNIREEKLLFEKVEFEFHS